MHVTPKQIKLARIALDWTQSELATHAGVSKDTIVKIEKERAKPQQVTYEKIVQALRGGGIEFLENNGIRERQTNIERYDGVDGFRDFMDDVYKVARECGGDICLLNSRPSLWLRLLGEDWYAMHSRRMAALGDRVRVRIIVEKGERDFILSFAEHRWSLKDRWRGKVFYVYGPKLGFLDFRENRIQITVLEEAEFSESFKIMYDVVWERETMTPTDA